MERCPTALYQLQYVFVMDFRFRQQGQSSEPCGLLFSQQGTLGSLLQAGPQAAPIACDPADEYLPSDQAAQLTTLRLLIALGIIRDVLEATSS